MIDNSSNKFVEITNRLNSLERVIAGVVGKDPNLVRCLDVFHTSWKMTQTNLIKVYHYVPFCNICSCSLLGRIWNNTRKGWSING
jgi:hypothetical protein